VIFKEVLRPPIWVLAFIYFLLLSLVIALWAAFDNTVAFTSFVAATIAIIYIAYAMRSTITFDGEELRIDRAHIESKYLGKVAILDSEAMRLLRTRDADPAAYLAIKFWTPTGIKIEVIDPRDPTPYWLITSKRGEEIAALLIKS
jgi:membrane protein implicated in regulation of membrane protease activity